MPTFNDLIKGALKEIRSARSGDMPSPDVMDDFRLLLNEILDEWNSDRRAVYNENYFDFTLTPGLSPHTIGPAGSRAGGLDPSFVVTQRPVKITYAALNLGGSPAVFRPIHIRDDKWYKRQPVPLIAQSVPTDLYFSPDWTDPTNIGNGYGAIYFWGVPNTAYSVRLWMSVLLAQVTDLTLNVSLPQGYYSALRLTLAVRGAPSAGQTVSADTKDAQRLACERIFGNNDQEPTIATADAGLARSGNAPNGFNWMSRTTS